jgi:molybdopterin converting factor small subunit
MKIKVKYFAQLRAIAKRNGEELELNGPIQASVLYDRLRETYGFPLTIDEIRVAANDEFVGKDYEISERDSIVFIPPVSGG